MIILKNDAEIEKMRQAGKMVAAAHREVSLHIQPGISLPELQEIVANIYQQHSAEPVFVVRQPNSGQLFVPCLISLNVQLGIPVDSSTALSDGDVVTLDTGCRLHGWCAEAAWSYPVGNVSPNRQVLLGTLQTTRDLLNELLSQLQNWREIAIALHEHARNRGLRLIDDIVGHGIGQELHEDPQLAWNLGETPAVEPLVMRPGMVFAVEWGLTPGKGVLRRLNNGGWETYDRAPCVHGEFTVACTESGLEVLTDID